MVVVCHTRNRVLLLAWKIWPIYVLSHERIKQWEVKVIRLFLTTKMIADRKWRRAAVCRVLLQMLWTHITGWRWPVCAIVPDKVKYSWRAMPRLYRYQVRVFRNAAYFHLLFALSLEFVAKWHLSLSVSAYENCLHPCISVCNIYYWWTFGSICFTTAVSS